jgi:hypothetical protein
MSEHDIKPLDDDLVALLRAEKHSPTAHPVSKERVLGRLDSSILALNLQPGLRGTKPVGSPRPSPRALLRARFGMAGPLTAAFLAGGVAGASVHAWIAPRAALPAPASIATPRPITAPRLEPTPSALPPTIESQAPPAPVAVETPAPVGSGGLNAERVLLDRARFAFSRGDDGAALEALGVHARRFPRGLLEEEREALAIKALVEAGRGDEAKARGARFGARFPDSFLLPSVNQALGTIR